jgi:hypothetical protein
MGKYFIFIFCCISSFTGCAAERVEPPKLKTTPSTPPTSVQVVIPKDAIKLAPAPQNVNIVIPEDSIKVDIPKQFVELISPDKMVEVTVPIPQVVVNIPNDAIRVIVPEQQQNLVIPEKAVVVNLVRSPLIWLTIIISAITFCISLISLIDKIRKDKKDDHKSLMDDFWYRTVIHPECTKVINDLYDELAKQLKADRFERSNHAKSFEIIHDSLAKLDQLSILPGGNITWLKISNLLQTVEEQITAYFLNISGQQTIQELIDSETPVPDDLIGSNSEKFCVDVKKKIFALLLEFHTKLSFGVEAKISPSNS